MSRVRESSSSEPMVRYFYVFSFLPIFSSCFFRVCSSFFHLWCGLLFFRIRKWMERSFRYGCWDAALLLNIGCCYFLCTHIFMLCSSCAQYFLFSLLLSSLLVVYGVRFLSLSLSLSGRRSVHVSKTCSRERRAILLVLIIKWYCASI